MSKLTFESSVPAASPQNKTLALLSWLTQLLFYFWPALRNTTSHKNHLKLKNGKCAVSEFVPQFLWTVLTSGFILLFLAPSWMVNRSLFDFQNICFFLFRTSFLVILTLLHLNRFFTYPRMPEGCHTQKWKHGKKKYQCSGMHLPGPLWVLEGERNICKVNPAQVPCICQKRPPPLAKANTWQQESSPKILCKWS